MQKDVQQSTEAWYLEYYRQKKADRNDVLRNPEVLLQLFAMESGLVQALRATGLDPQQARVLDVGCGTGASILYLLKMGFDPRQMDGIDIYEERIREARARLAHVNWVHGDASAMTYPDGTFDLCTASTMFVQITEEALASAIADEMLRVTRPGGYIVLIDWRYAAPRDTTYRAVSGKRIAALFKVGDTCRLRGVYKGALLPPVGRRLSRMLPSCYFLVRGLFPFLVAQVVTVLQKAE